MNNNDNKFSYFPTLGELLGVILYLYRPVKLIPAIEVHSIFVFQLFILIAVLGKPVIRLAKAFKVTLFSLFIIDCLD